MVIEFGHTLQIPNDYKSCENCPQDFDHEEVDPVSVITEPVSKCRHHDHFYENQLIMWS